MALVVASFDIRKVGGELVASIDVHIAEQSIGDTDVYADGIIGGVFKIAVIINGFKFTVKIAESK